MRLIIPTFIFIVIGSCSNHKDNKTIVAASIDTVSVNKDSLKTQQLIKDYDLNRTDTFDVGDVDADGRMDTAFINPLKFFFHNGQIDSQYVNISFTANVNPIKHYNGFQGIVVNAGDLDGNKTDEVIYLPDWYQSNSAMFYIYGYKKQKWVQFTKGEIRRDIAREQKDELAFLKSRVKKINNGSFKLTEHIMKDTEFVDSTRIILIDQ